MDHHEAVAKMEKVRQLNAAMDRLRASMKTENNYANALALQSLKRQRDEIMGTFPGIRLVHG